MRTNKRAGAIIVKDGKLLLIHRKKHGDEYWVLPGGGVEEGETLEEALYREVMEETCLKLKTFKFIHHETDQNNTEHHFYKVEIEEGEPKLGGPEQEANSEDNWYHLEWVSIEDVLKIDDLYPKAVKELLK